MNNNDFFRIPLSKAERISGINQIRQDIRNKKPINIKNYNDNTVIRNYTNCMAYALGTYCSYSQLYRPGIISQEKYRKDQFMDEFELRDLFVKDCKYLNLKVTPFGATQEDLVKYAENFKFRKHEYLIGLFAIKYADGKIRGFHFVRYDPDIGWSEKSGFGGYATKMDNINVYLEKFEYSFAGGFIINRNCHKIEYLDVEY